MSILAGQSIQMKNIQPACRRFRRNFFIIVSVLGILTPHDARSQASQPVFGRQNLVAWCIVPFDVKKRGPVERADMLQQLKIGALAYDWRTEHIPQFDAELKALNDHHIALQAFWLHSGADTRTDKNVQTVFSFLKRNHVKTQIWYMLSMPKSFDSLPQAEKVAAAAASVSNVADAADSIGCTVGLYNHNGWFGEPENELAIIALLKRKNLGMVYNFNHAQDQIERFPAFFPKILPHLIALNLAGLKKGDQRIYPIGQGDSELEMIRVIKESNYTGPIGIINEDTDPDAKVGLEMNMSGLKEILTKLGDRAALATYK